MRVPYPCSAFRLSYSSRAYSGFAFVPLFLLWVFMCWMSVLFGAEVAAAHARRQGDGKAKAAEPEGEPSPPTSLPEGS